MNTDHIETRPEADDIFGDVMLMAWNAWEELVVKMGAGLVVICGEDLTINLTARGLKGLQETLNHHVEELQVHNLFVVSPDVKIVVRMADMVNAFYAGELLDGLLVTEQPAEVGQDLTPKEKIKALASQGWEVLVKNRRDGATLNYGSTVALNCNVEEAIPVLEKLIVRMAEKNLAVNIQISDGGDYTTVHMADYVKAMGQRERPAMSLITTRARESDVLVMEPDMLATLADQYRKEPSPLSIRGKSGMHQSMVLQALNAAFGGAGVPTAYQSRTYRGNNAATSLLGRIGQGTKRGKK